MSDDSAVQFVASRPRKRPRREMSESSADRPSGEATSSSSSSRPPGLPLPPIQRYPGDGLDFRRPISSQPDQVIDLTNEPDSPDRPEGQPERRPRPPRFPRDILSEVVDLEEEHDPEPQQEAPSSPEVQFVGATVRRPQLPPPPPPPYPRHEGTYNFWEQLVRLRSPLLSVPHRTLLFPDHDGPDFSYRRHGPRMARRGPRLAGVESLFIGDDPTGAIDLTINLDVDGPLGLDYQITGLTPERAPASSYKPPSPPPEGFTRNVAEDDVVVCPNCYSELGIGNEVKQQIWVVKQCGHVYCGECASNRAISKAKKTGPKTKPFSKCLVADCGKTVSSPKAMFQIYL
ncbi:hypothetical protein BO71DRAFT_404187 [Aspergillus ellipticus CBS 707.79]|uniref:RING finger domain protein n=1 Tax=Aspergillus ellipticus CBS 707.79 TaxID=1448320 RepID=A0A319CTF8_9EURO|nr:hypothetical protein BO71DRAFT_404187 [Aspergillus ellipticus CBS 707.79]